MVLSLGFILAFIGAAVALLIGILIFSEVSDSIICPAGGSPGGGEVAFNIESYEDLSNQFLAVYEEAESPSFFQVAGPTTPSGGGLLSDAVTQNGTSSGQTNGEILLADASQWNFLHQLGTGSNLTSINMWINGDTVGSSFYPILTNHAQVEGDGFQMGTDQGRLLVLMEQSGLKWTLNIADFPLEPPDDGQWHMLSVSYDKGATGATGRYLICVDATCETNSGAGSAWTSGIVGAVDPLTIGSDSDHATSGGVVENTFDVDDLGIWTGYELTQGDITTLYNSGVGVPANTISPLNMIAYWSFDNSTAIGSLGETLPSTEAGQGSAECEGAKDTAWTVIGILPVALFFALFAIFGALGRNN